MQPDGEAGDEKPFNFLPCMLGSNQLYLYLETHMCELSASCRSCFLRALLFEAIPKALLSGWQSNKAGGLLGSFSCLPGKDVGQSRTSTTTGKRL